MTQMMLFDTCSPTAASTSVPASATASAPVPASSRPPLYRQVGSTPSAGVSGDAAENQPISGRPPARASRPAGPPSRTVSPQHENGLHTMGDLAQLVLLRYQLVAKRREAMAARSRSSNPRRSASSPIAPRS